jgi:hypothetical protein
MSGHLFSGSTDRKKGPGGIPGPAVMSVSVKYLKTIADLTAKCQGMGRAVLDCRGAFK